MDGRFKDGGVLIPMRVPFGLAERCVHAGPFQHAPFHMVGVKLAPEVEGPATFELPIRDFSIPTCKPVVDEVLVHVLTTMSHNFPVYVGCRGGLGRTGLFLALMVKTMGEQNPVQYVRRNYHERAVETSLQERYVGAYTSPLSAWDVRRLKMQAIVFGFSPRVD